MENNMPLAYRMCPTTIDEYVGQEHILSKDKMLYTFFTFFAPDLIDADNSYKKNYLNNKIVEIFGKNVIFN